MTKLYYDCPIKALYMMKEFDVKYICDEGIHVGVDHLVDFIKYKYTDLIYIHPDSYDIFEALECDIGEFHNKACEYEVGRWYYINANDPLTLTIKPNIIMRDGKQFFHAKKGE